LSEDIKRLKLVQDEQSRELKQVKLNQSLKGSQTRAELVQSLETIGHLTPSLEFTEWLRSRKVKFWLNRGEDIAFPALGSKEAEGTEPFVRRMIEKLSDMSNWEGPKGGNVKQTLKSIPIVSTSTKTIGKRKPDVPAYVKDSNGVFAITMIAEIKGYYSDGNFSGEHIGQLLEFISELFRIQGFREEMISLLFDGYRFQFIKSFRSQGELRHEESLLFQGKEGWQVAALSLCFTACDFCIALGIHWLTLH